MTVNGEQAVETTVGGWDRRCRTRASLAGRTRASAPTRPC